MNDELPDPPVPADVDLRKKDYMPLYGDVLLTSTAWTMAPPEVRGFMVQLWWHAWSKELPASSLPNHEGKLLALAGLQARPDLWKQHREAIMQGFYLCSDGRLYHAFLAEKVLELLQSRSYTAARVATHRLRPGARPAVTLPPVTSFPPNVTPPGGTRDDTTRNDNSGASHHSGRGDNERAVNAYNEQAEKWGWPKATRFSQERVARLSALLRQNGVDRFCEALASVSQSAFLTRGEGARPGWVPDLDFFLTDQNFNRLLEGFYNDRNRGTGDGAKAGRGGFTGAALQGILAAGRKRV